MDDRWWPWIGVVIRAQERLLRVPHRRRPDGHSLHERLQGLRHQMAWSRDLWVEGEHQRRARPWRAFEPRDARWFVDTARENQIGDATIRVLFGIEPDTAEPARPEGRIEGPEPIEGDAWDDFEIEDDFPGADFNDGDGWDPIGPAEHIDEEATLQERVERLVERIVEQIAYDVTIAPDEREA